jgi:hypothetical protein
MPQILERRVNGLEAVMADLAQAIVQTERQIERTERRVDQTSREMAVFKDEMAVFRDRIDMHSGNLVTYGERLDAHGANLDMYGARLDAAVARIERSIADAAKDTTKMRREWGELSRRLGTMAEDLVAPSIPRIVRTVLGCPEKSIESIAVRVKRRSSIDHSHMREFDVAVACGEYLLVNETKTRLTPEHVSEFAALLPRVREYFPEYAEKRVIGALASLYVDESLVRHGERQGLIILGFGEDLMDVLNSEGFVPQAF